ncbi:MAG: PilZ domain-containing protein [Proteobacteria bacterium]|nr:PilZ domain-containing protein [Pseudomonadota bacterium]
MSVLEPETSDADAPEPVAPVVATTDGRERRQHGRWKIVGAYVQISDTRFPLVDISMGGFQLRGDESTIDHDGIFSGSIVWPDGGRHNTVDFKARVVRVEPEHELVGIAFQPMDGKQIDQLLGMLTTVEGKWRGERERADRAVTRRRFIRRLVTGLSVIGLAGAAGYAVWILTVGTV